MSKPQSKPKKTKHTAKSQAETKKIASKLLQDMGHKGIICLYGSLGAGKTTFVKGLSESLGIPEMSIKSPTYTYLREYITPTHSIYHFDLYRLEGKPEVARHMVQEVLEKNPDLLLIEWAEYLGSFLPEKRTDIFIEVEGDTDRIIRIEER
ncbi:MAG: tRNA (adenosine(37)-N6)-threonylcarbamoyltransferase complex ATPase subunit type 1 TsaE [Candidatus Gracilibacteria bacterium]